MITFGQKNSDNNNQIIKLIMSMHIGTAHIILQNVDQWFLTFYA